MANTTICLYGRSGTFKTTQIGFLSQYIYERTGKITRLISADGGGWKPLLPYIEGGLIEPYSIRNEANPIFTLHKLVQGYWPTKLESGKRLSKEFSLDTSNIGAYAIEGVTTISELIIDHLAGKKLGMNPAYSLTLTASGESITSGQESVKKFDAGEKFIDTQGQALGDVISGAYSQDHYGYVQKTVIEKLVMSWNLPVELVLWTSHEATAEDDLTRTAIYGPALVGKKGTPKIGRNVGVLIHAEPFNVTKPNAPNTKPIEATEVRYYFMSHPNQLMPKVTWECKPRIPSVLMPELLKKWPDAYFTPTVTKGLDEYLRLEDSLINKGTNDIREWKQKLDAAKNIK